MTYNLKFHPSALSEWEKLPVSLKSPFKKKLAQRLLQPHVPKARLSEEPNFYKIKLKSSGYRLAYEVIDKDLIVYVFAVDRRDRNSIYKKAFKRKSSE